MNAYTVFAFGVALLGLFFWYFGTDDEKRKRLVGTVLTVLVTGFCAYAFARPKDGEWFGNITKGIDLQGGNSFVVRIVPDGDNKITKEVQEKAITILEARLNAYGTTDVALIPQGEDRIEIQMPGVKEEDRQTYRDMLQKVAKLEFRLVNPNSASLIAAKKSPTDPLIEPGFVEVPMIERHDEEKDAETPLDMALQKKAALTTSEVRGRIQDFKSKEEFKVGKKVTVAVNDKTEIKGGKWEDAVNDRYVAVTGEVQGRGEGARLVAKKLSILPSIVVKNKANVSGDQVQRAGAFQDQGLYKVSIRLTDAGAKEMQKTTETNVGQQLAIILDGEVISAPRINSPLSQSFEITGDFTLKQAQDLASNLNNPMRNPLEILDERAVSATYGQDTIRQGLYAGVAGLIAILVFMVIYYRAAGFIAIVGLVVNAIILFGFMAISHSTLTMLGIAGVILTIGMAVDANVLIYERLREEFKAGKSVEDALHAGYDRAFSAIFDGHMTSLITAAILFILASGTIKGFAVSLTIGLLASLFGSLLVTRTLFNWFPSLRSTKFLDLIKNRSIDFLGRTKQYFIFSAVLTVITIAALVWKGQNALGADLRGGDQISIQGHEEVTNSLVDEVKMGIDNNALPQRKSTIDGQSFLQIRTIPGKGPALLAAIEKKIGAQLQGSSVEAIGPQVGKEMLWTSGKALFIGLLGIFIYLALRFEASFSLGAIIALSHDLFVCVGAILLTGRELNLLQVGALLTIAGYSVTDTIVIFDRIREYLHSKHGDLRTIMNDAISSTLSRTLLTSCSTLVTIISLYLFGGPSLADFSFTIVVGIVVGTYSSICVASPIVLWWANKRKLDLRADVVEAVTAKALAESGIEREVAPRRI